MKKIAIKRSVVIWAAVLVVVFVAYGIFIQALRKGESEMILEVPSPAGGDVAYIESLTMDVTGLVMYSLGVRSENQAADIDQQLVYDTWSELDVKWINDEMLFVANQASIDSVQEMEKDGIAIVYSRIIFDGDTQFYPVQILDIIPSPNGETLAYLYKIASTDPNAYGAVLLEPDRAFSYNISEQDIYIAYQPFDLQWRDDGTVLISNSDPESLYRQKQHNEIRIEFDSVSAAA